MDSTGQHFEVDAPLNEVVNHLYCIRTSENTETLVQHLSPNMEMMLVFNFGRPVRFSFGEDPFQGHEMGKTAFIGPLRKMLNYEVLPGTDLIAVLFNASGFYRLFQLPIDSLHEEIVMDPDALMDIDGFKMLWQELNKLKELEQRIALLKEYGLSFIGNLEEASLPLLNGMKYFQEKSIQPVRFIAMENDLSERTVQLRFKKYMGYSPKELLRFTRFKKVIHHILQHENKPVDWYHLIEAYGYHDQSHLIKDFKHYLGTTPLKFVKDMVGKEFCVVREKDAVNGKNIIT